MINGNRALKAQVNDVTHQQPFDYSQFTSGTKHPLESLLLTFKSKEFNNRSLLLLERTFELQR